MADENNTLTQNPIEQQVPEAPVPMGRPKGDDKPNVGDLLEGQNLPPKLDVAEPMTPDEKLIKERYGDAALASEQINKKREAAAEVQSEVALQQEQDALELGDVEKNIIDMENQIKDAEKYKVVSTPLKQELKQLRARQIELKASQITEVEEVAKRAPASGEQREAINARISNMLDQDTELEVSRLRKQQAAMQAQQVIMDERVAEQRFIADEALEEMRKEDLVLKEIIPNHFWNDAGVWGKIGMGLAVVAGVAGGGTIPLVMSLINNDIESQKLNNNQKLAKREEAYRRVNIELNRLKGLTDNKFKQQNYDVALQKFGVEQVKANKERQQSLASSKVKNMIIKKGVKLEDLDPSIINRIMSKDDYKLAKGLRDEFNKQTIKLGTREVVNAFGDIEALSNYIASGPTDIFLLTKAMKFIDPTSVVREGEFRIAETASPPSRIVSRLARKFAKGTRLTPTDRKLFAQNALLLLKVKLKNQKAIGDRYKSLSRQHGLPDSLVVENFLLKSASKKEAMWEKRKKKYKSREAFDRTWEKMAKKHPDINK